MLFSTGEFRPFEHDLRVLKRIIAHLSFSSLPALLSVAPKYFFKKRVSIDGSQGIQASRYENECMYLSDGRKATMEVLFLDNPLVERFDRFLALGYRRYGRALYRPACIGCDACIPLRIRPREFRPSERDCRTLKRNGDIKTVVARPCLTREKAILLKKYLLTRHRKAGFRLFEHPDIQLIEFLESYPHTFEVDYYLGRKLICVCILDEGPSSLSWVYSFYDTDYMSRGLGRFSTVRAIELARTLGKEYIYLGHYIETAPRMSYKIGFMPNERLILGTWSRSVAGGRIAPA